MRPAVVAHRGASAYVVENTVEAVVEAFRLGADAVEVDVRCSKDGVLVALHDEDLARLAGVKRRVSELSFAELSSIKLRGGLRVARLEEVLEAARGRWLVVELKEPGLEEALVEALSAFQGRVLVSSFIHPSLVKVKELAPWVETGAVYTCLPVKPVQLAVDAGVDVVFPRRDFVTWRVVEEAHSVGLKVYPWVVDEPSEVRRLASMGVDGVVTNRPDVALRALSEGLGLEAWLNQ